MLFQALKICRLHTFPLLISPSNCLSVYQSVFLLNHHSTDKKVMKVQIGTIRVQGVTHQTEISGGFITSCVMILL